MLVAVAVLALCEAAAVLAWESVPALAGSAWLRALATFGLSIALGIGLCALMCRAFRAAGRRLSESEARYRTMVESADDFVCRFLADGRLTFVNDSCCRYVGRSHEDLVGRSHPGLLPPLSRERLQDTLAEVERSGVSRAEIPDGAGRWHEWITRAIRDSDGNVLEYQTVGRDVTARRLAADGLERLNAELEQHVADRTRELEVAVRELESFSYAVSHDLRAPLRAIDGFCHIVAGAMPPEVPAEITGLLPRIRQQAQLMGVLIDDLLTLAQVSRAELLREEVDVGAVAAECVAVLRRSDPERRVDVTLHPGIAMQADPHLLRVALAQLLDNAWKFTRGRDLPRIEVGLATRLGRRVAYVKDNGAGFDMAYVERLFTEFRRLHTERELAGSGIGLAIVQRVVQRHGGQIWAEGRLGEGATFFFTLGAA